MSKTIYVVLGEEGSYDEGSERWMVRAFANKAAAEALAEALNRLMKDVTRYNHNRPLDDRRARMAFWTHQSEEELALRAKFEKLDESVSSDKLRNSMDVTYGVEDVELEEAG